MTTSASSSPSSETISVCAPGASVRTLKTPLLPENGYLRVPDGPGLGPGLGIDLDEEAAERLTIHE